MNDKFWRGFNHYTIQTRLCTCHCVYYCDKDWKSVLTNCIISTEKVHPKSDFKMAAKANIGPAWAGPTGPVPAPLLMMFQWYHGDLKGLWCRRLPVWIPMHLIKGALLSMWLVLLRQGEVQIVTPQPCYVPVAVEKCGVFGRWTLHFVKELRKRLR